MTENKNTEYIPETEEKKDEAIAEPATQEIKADATATPAEALIDDIDDEDEEEEGKSNVLFGVICAVLCVAIAFTSILSVLKINKFLNTSTETAPVEEQEVNRGYNIYTQMFPKYKATKFPANLASDLTSLSLQTMISSAGFTFPERM